MPEETVGAAETAFCDCDPCKRKRHEPHNVRDGVIHEYTSRPSRGWVPRYTTDEQAAGLETGHYPPTFGVELETVVPTRPYIEDLPGQPRPAWYAVGDAERAEQEAAYNAWSERNAAHHERERRRLDRLYGGNLTAHEAAALAAPRGLWHAKHDGSVNGPEFASQPATLAYWRAQRVTLGGMYKALLHGGARSHDGDRAGLHVNIGTGAFDDEDHLARFARLVSANPRWATRMAQRTHESVAHWAPFTLGDDDEIALWAREVFRYGYASQNRYCVLNARNPGRIEFRLPRGTLRLDRFYAKLEWTAAMVEYTRDASRPVQVSAFMRWADASGEYPALAAFMWEKFPQRLEGVTE